MIFRSRHTRHRDAELVTLVADGNERVFGELLQRHQDAVYGFAHRMLNDAQEAEDVTQEAVPAAFPGINPLSAAGLVEDISFADHQKYLH
jgi:DNA-directed RNA polymerase specialized sigma24 family protein